MSTTETDFLGLNEEFQRRRQAESAVQEQSLRSSAAVASAASPDRAAQVSKMSQVSGIPAPVVHRNFEEVSKRFEQARMDSALEVLRKNNPKLADWMAKNPEHPALVKDDLSQMGLLDSTLQRGRNLFGALAAGPESGVSGFWRAVQGAADLGRENITGPSWAGLSDEVNQVLSYYDPFVQLSTVARRAAERTEQAANELRGEQKGAGPLEKAGYSGVESIGQMLLTIPLSILTGSPEPALAGMGLMQGGQSYQEGRSEGLSVNRAAVFGAIQGAVEVGTEKLPVETLLHNFSLGSGLFKTVLDELKTEIPGEQVATLLQDLNQWAMIDRNKGKPLSDYVKERPSAALDTLVATVVATVGMSAPSSLLAHKTAQEQVVQDLGDNTKAAKLMERYPEKLQEYIRSAMTGGSSQVWLPHEAVTEYYQKQGLDPQKVTTELTGDSNAYAQAVASGADIAVPIEKFSTDIAATDAASFFGPKVRFDPQAQNIEEMDASLNESVQRLMGDQSPTPDQEAQASAQEQIHQDIIGQMTRPGADPSVIEHQAQQMAHFFVTVAAITRVDPVALWQRYGLKITHPVSPLLAALPQTDMIDVILDRLRAGDVPSQKSLFGNSLVEWLRESGGVQDAGGDLASREPDKGLMPFTRKLIQTGGMSLDTAVLRAREEGYIPETSDINEFIDTIDKELRGEPVYSQHVLDTPKAQEADALFQMDRYLKKNGFDLNALSNEQVKKILEEASNLDQTGNGVEFLQQGEDTGFAPEKQPRKERARKEIARGSFTPGRPSLMRLFEAENFSTFLHESGHFYLEVFGDLVAELKAKEPATLTVPQQRMIADYGKVLAFLGVGSREEIGKEQHEKWAEAIESYFQEGKAPDPELRSAFTRFRSWLRGLYNEVKVRLNPDIRQVMDRLFASDEAIAQARDEEAADAVFTTADDAGMSEQEFNSYRESLQKEHDASRERLEKQIVEEEARTRTEWWEAEKQKVHDSVAKQVYQQREYKALYALSKWTNPDGTPLPDVGGKLKLDIAAVRERFGKGSTKKGADGIEQGSAVTNRLRRLDILREEGGLHPDVVAPMFGFVSGDDLVLAIANARPMEPLIEAETQRIMEERHGKKTMDGTIHERARVEVASKGRSAIIIDELKALLHLQAKQMESGRRILQRGIPMLKDAAVRVADRQIRDSVLSKLRPHQFWAAAGRASKTAIEAVTKKDFAEAIKQKEQELLSLELYRAATDAREDVAETRKAFAKFFGSDQRIEKTRNMDFVSAARMIAARFLTAARVTSAGSEFDKVRQYDPDLYETLQDHIEMAMAKDPKTMTYDDFTFVKETAFALWNQALEIRQFKTKDEKLQLDDVAERIAVVVRPLASKDAQSVNLRAANKWDKLHGFILNAQAFLRRVEFWAHSLDGGKHGDVQRFITDPIFVAAAEQRVDFQQLVERVHEAAKKLKGTIHEGEIAAPELGYVFENGAELLRALGHTGNASNLQKMLRGRKDPGKGRAWGEFREDGTLNSSRWDAFLARMKAEGIYRQEHIDYWQTVWDIFAEKKPQLQKANKEMYGVYFQEVKIDPIQTPWGERRGGYLPAKVDPRASSEVAARGAIESLGEANNRYALPAIERGSTKSRVEQYAGPLDLGRDMVVGHLAWATRFIHLAPVVKQAGRLMRHRTFAGSMDAMNPQAINEMLLPWLQRTVAQKITKQGESEFIDRAASTLRNNVGMSVMVGSLVNGLQQGTGLLVATSKVKPSHLAWALARYLSSPVKSKAFIESKAPEMALSNRARVQEIMGSMDKIVLDSNLYQDSKAWVKQHGYFIAVAIQDVVSNSVWMGAFNQAQEKGESDPESVRLASQAVRLTQGEYTAESLSRYETGTSFSRLFTMFTTYPNLIANLNATEMNIAKQMGVKKGLGRAVYVYAMTIALPSIISKAISWGVRGVPDEDDDALVFDLLLGSQIEFATAFLPLGSAVYRKAASSFTKGQFGDSIQVSPAVAAIDALASAPGEAYNAYKKGRASKKDVSDWLKAISTLTGYPVTLLEKPIQAVAVQKKNDLK